MKRLGAGFAGLSMTGMASASRRSHGSQVMEADFNPSSREETLQYLYRTLKQSASEDGNDPEEIRSVLKDRLSVKQKQSLKNALEEDVGKEVKTTIQETSPSSGEVRALASSFESYSYTISTEITVPVACGTVPGCTYKTFAAYDFTHELQWYYDDNGVISGSATCEGTGHDYAVVWWAYEGRTSYQKQTHPDGYYVKTFREGKFDQNIILDQAPGRLQYPSCWVQGDDNGSGSAYDIQYK